MRIRDLLEGDTLDFIERKDQIERIRSMKSINDRAKRDNDYFNYDLQSRQSYSELYHEAMKVFHQTRIPGFNSVEDALVEIMTSSAWQQKDKLSFDEMPRRIKNAMFVLSGHYDRIIKAYQKSRNLLIRFISDWMPIKRKYNKRLLGITFAVAQLRSIKQDIAQLTKIKNFVEGN